MSRYYDPAIGQFISPDTSDYLKPNSIGGIDLYAYCGNNPVMRQDPTGHFWKVLGITIAAIATVAVVATAVALTAGAAAVAIAGAVGASSVATLAVGGVVATTALASGIVVGTSEVIKQGIDKGFENINILSTAIQTASGGFDGAMIAGAIFLPQGSTAMLALGRVVLSGLVNYAYGYSEGYDNETIKGNVASGMALTAGMSTLMFLPNSLSRGSLILQPFKTSGIKIGAAIIEFLLGV